MYYAKDRKNQHLDLAKFQFETEIETNSLESIELPYCALPEIDFNSANLETDFLNKKLLIPLIISGMTGGTDRSRYINEALAEVAEEHGLGMGIGSQRASLETGNSQKTLRKIAPNIPLIGNIGGIQLASTSGIDLARRAVDDIEANALAIHLNPLQEIVQPEGEHDWRGVLNAIEKTVKLLPCPVIVKEVGRGLSKEVIIKLFDVGVKIFDVAGMGGTNWTKIEASRRLENDKMVYQPFYHMGITLKKGIIDASTISENNTIIGSGGIKNGLDIARAIWIGADLVAMAGVILKKLEDDNNKINKVRLYDFINDIKKQLKIALFITGSQNIRDFSEKSEFRQIIK